MLDHMSGVQSVKPLVSSSREIHIDRFFPHRAHLSFRKEDLNEIRPQY